MKALLRTQGLGGPPGRLIPTDVSSGPRCVSTEPHSTYARAPDSRRQIVGELALLALAATPRAALAWMDHGVFYPDEIHQSLEPAHWVAFGYGFRAWEFHSGARSWLFPGMLGGLWKMADVLGASQGATLVLLAKLAMVALALATALAGMRLATCLGGQGSGVMAGVLLALFPASLVFSGRAMSEMVSAPLLAWATLWVLTREGRTHAAAGVLAGVATVLRCQNGVLAVMLAMVLAIRHRRLELRWFALGFGGALLAGGLVDLFTWGRFWQSWRVYVQFNLIESKATAYGTAPSWYYAETLATSTGRTVWLLALGLALAWRRCRALLLLVASFVMVHALVPHKELRFIMPVVPLLLTAAAIGLMDGVTWCCAAACAEGRSLAPRRAALASATALAILCCAMGISMTARARTLTFDQMGQHEPMLGPHVVWHWNEPLNRLLWDVGQREDLCGLAFVGYVPAWTGGYAYLHRRVPLTNLALDPLLERQAVGAAGQWTNYVIAPEGITMPSDYRQVRAIDGARLLRRSGECAPLPVEVAAGQYDLEAASARASARGEVDLDVAPSSTK